MESTFKVKDEIAVLPDKHCCQKAMLSALIHTAGTLSFSNDGMGMIVTSENAKVRTLITELIKSLFAADAEVGRREIVIHGSFVTQMLLELGILVLREGLEVQSGASEDLFHSKCCESAYLGGAFMGCGSLSVKSKYHLEMNFSTEKLGEDIVRIMNGYGIESKAITRKGRMMVYIKNNDGIRDFLLLIGALESALILADTAMQRAVKRKTISQFNCEMHNLDKTINVSTMQKEHIIKIYDKIEDEKLRETAEMRLRNPEASYDELGKLLGVSKSTIRYRLNKLNQISQEEK